MSVCHKFLPHPKAEERRRSIAQLIRILVAIDDPLVRPEQKLQAIDTLLWKFTEADGKHNTPFRSIASLAITSKELLQHEHVSTRKQLKHKLISSKPEDVDSVLREAVGCIVTIEEHEKLTRHDGRASGWERYELAGVAWTDLRKAE